MVEVDSSSSIETPLRLHDLDEFKSRTPDRVTFGLVLSPDVLRCLRAVFGDVEFVTSNVVVFARGTDGALAVFSPGDTLSLSLGTQADRDAHRLTVIGACVLEDGSRHLVCESTRFGVITVLAERDLQFFTHDRRHRDPDVGRYWRQLESIIS